MRIKSVYEDVFLGADFKSLGCQMYALCAELFPICRSITGDGFRKSLEMLSSAGGGGLISTPLKVGHRFLIGLFPMNGVLKTDILSHPAERKSAILKTIISIF